MSYTHTPYTDQSDLEIVRLVQTKKDREAFAELVYRYQTIVTGRIRNFFYNLDEEATAQDIFLHLWKKIDQFKGNSLFKTWFYKLTHNFCINASKKESRRREVFVAIVELEDDDLEHVEGIEETTAADEIIRAEDKLLTMAAIKTLPAEKRVALRLFVLKGLSYREIAELESIPEGTARSRVCYARRALRQRLAGKLQRRFVL